jgi:flavin-dependent dehydrogenase
VPADSLQETLRPDYDIVICGGGLAGLTLARQLRRTHPSQTILVVERTTRPLPDAAHKVGESSVELGSQYLERLGLRDYLGSEHIFKYGLRFFPGGGQLPIEDRYEIGPSQEPIVPSYQIDRGRFENDLRRMIVEDGVTLLEGVKVGAIELNPGETPHEVELRRVRAAATAEPPAAALSDTNTAADGAEAEAKPSPDGAALADPDGHKARIRCRWLVDATGRAALLRKRLKLTRGTRHAANASWFRVEGAVDITRLVPEGVGRWHDVAWATHRIRSTNHLMGPGYWVWIIPLATGNTSIGVVVHDSHHSFDEIRTLERTQAFLTKNEPVLARFLDAFPILDFGALRSYSHNVARSWSADRWAIVGEAGAFVDPLYSPGTDFIAITNSFTEEMVRRDLEGGCDLAQRARELSALYRSIVGGGVDLYRDAAEVYGHADALMAKIYWDNFIYWSYPCQLFLQGLYRLTGPELAEVVPVGQRFSELTLGLQHLFAAWAELAPAQSPTGFRPMPTFPSVLVEAHVALRDEMNPSETLTYMKKRLAEGEEIAGEILLRAMDEVGAEKIDALLERAKVGEWRLRIADERVSAFEAIGLARRRALRPLARDVERSLGRAPHRVDEQTIRRALGSIIVPALEPQDPGLPQGEKTRARA